MNGIGASGFDLASDGVTPLLLSDWVQWNMHVGQSYFVDLPFELGLDFAALGEEFSQFGFNIDASNGMRFELSWDLRLGFGISVVDGFFLDAGATDEVGDDVEELRLIIADANTGLLLKDTGPIPVDLVR